MRYRKTEPKAMQKINSPIFSCKGVKELILLFNLVANLRCELTSDDDIRSASFSCSSVSLSVLFLL